MDKSLGTKWFTFYTKVRPWFACLATFSVVFDFLQHIEVYTSYWWMMLYFIGSVTQAVLAIIVFVKSRGDYIDFVSFVSGVLLFETINMAYAICVSQYIDNGFKFDGVSCAVVLSIAYLVWYCLNLKYFKKRILSTIYTSSTYDNPFIIEPITTEHTKILYCRKCGEKLINDSKFCRKCGTEIIEEVGRQDNEV